MIGHAFRSAVSWVVNLHVEVNKSPPTLIIYVHLLDPLCRSMIPKQSYQSAISLHILILLRYKLVSRSID